MRLRFHLSIVLFSLLAAFPAPAADAGEAAMAVPLPSARIRVTVARSGEDSGAVAAASRPHPGDSREEPEKSAPEAPETVAAAAGNAFPTLAIFDGRVITSLDVMRELWSRRGREALDWLIGEAILEKELSRHGLSVTESETDGRLKDHLESLRHTFPGLDDPGSLVRAASGMGLDEYRRKAVWMELALRKIMRAALSPSEEKLRSYYAERQAEFIRPERVRVSQVFIAPRADPEDDGVPGPKDWETAERQIVEAHSRLRMREDFSLVARAYGSGGQISRWVGLGELLRELEDAAFSMRPGSFSNPIRTAMGFHIIRSEERAERRLPTFEEVREKVAAEYEDRFFLLMAGEFMAKLREDALRDGSLILEKGREDEGDGAPLPFPETPDAAKADKPD